MDLDFNINININGQAQIPPRLGTTQPLLRSGPAMHVAKPQVYQILYAWWTNMERMRVVEQVRVLDEERCGPPKRALGNVIEMSSFDYMSTRTD